MFSQFQALLAQFKEQKVEHSEITETLRHGFLELERKTGRKEFVSKFKGFAYQIAEGACYDLEHLIADMLYEYSRALGADLA